jgi:glycerol-3-phosphate acyltransferase PlsY
MSNGVLFLVTSVAAYLIGSFPTGFLVVLALTRRDVRKIGSGRMGGTNALRAAGITGAVFTGIGDFAKGLAAVMIGRWLTKSQGTADSLLPWIEATCGILAVVGHIWPVFLRFRGGVGTATSAGAACAIWPLSGPLWVVLVPTTMYITRYGSMASLVAAFLLPLALGLRTWLAGAPWQHIVFGVSVTILIVWALVPNIKRLLNGKERKIHLQKKDQNQ